VEKKKGTVIGLNPNKRVKGHYYVSLVGGICGIRTAANLQQAKRNALREDGTNNVEYVRPATEEDVAWVTAMGGGVYE